MSALILHPREIQALWSQNYETGSYVVPGRQQWYNAMRQQKPYASYPDISYTEKEQNKGKVWHQVVNFRAKKMSPGEIRTDAIDLA